MENDLHNICTATKVLFFISISAVSLGLIVALFVKRLTKLNPFWGLLLLLRHHGEQHTWDRLDLPCNARVYSVLLISIPQFIVSLATIYPITVIGNPNELTWEEIFFLNITPLMSLLSSALSIWFTVSKPIFLPLFKEEKQLNKDRVQCVLATFWIAVFALAGGAIVVGIAFAAGVGMNGSVQCFNRTYVVGSHEY